MLLNLEDYQKLMRDFLVNHDRAAGFCGVGIGKTASTLSAIASLKAMGEIRNALIVAPLRVATLTWPNEVRKWETFSGMSVCNLRREPFRKADLYTINYESLHRLPSLDAFDVIVFDELTRAKNPASSRINDLRAKLDPGLRRWGLTGTPRPNSLLELFAQVRLLDDGQRLGRSYDLFRRTWFTPEDWNEYRWIPKPDAEKRIYEKIADLAITLRSSDYLHIPETIVEDVEVALPKDAHALYRELERELLVMLEDKEIVALNAAVLVNKLLQVCSGCVYDQGKTPVDVHVGKVHALKRTLTEIAPDRAIIATNYIHERARICAAVPGAVDGHMFRGDIEDAWNSGKIKYLVADARSLGHGLNLQGGGRTVIWFSPTYSRELYDQFNARVIRKGQKDVTRIYRIICPGTIDDAVLETLRVRGDEQTEMLAILSNLRLMGATFR